MTSNFKYLFPICALCLLCLFTTSCEKQALEPDSGSPQAALLVTSTFGQTISSNCNGYLGEGLAFPLDVETGNTDTDQGGIIGEGFSYNVFLGTTPLYEIGTDCVCEIQSYTLQFSDMSQVQSVNVVDPNGVAVPVSVNIASNTIVVAANYVGVDLAIGLVSTPGATAPALLAADGFCIVDNISTPNNRVFMEEAYIMQVFNPITLDFSRRVYIPTSVATAFVN